MQSGKDSETTNLKTIFLYLLVFRWLALIYILLFLALQKSNFRPLNYGVLFVAILYALCLTLFKNFTYREVTRKPALLAFDLFLAAIFLILGGWPQAWFFYSLTPIVTALLFSGYIQEFIFAAVICGSYLLSFTLNSKAPPPSQDLVRFDTLLFPIAGILFASGALTVLFYQRKRNLNFVEELQAKFSEASDKLEEAENRSTNSIIEAIQDAASMMALKDPAEVLSLLLERARKLVQAEKAVAALFDRKSGKVRIDPGTLVVKGRRDQHLESWWKDELDEMTKIMVDREGQRGAFPADESFTDCVLRKSDKNTSLICIPLKAGNKFMGVLSVLNAYPYFYTDDEVNLLSVLADQAAAVIVELKRPKTRSRVGSSELEKELERITTQCLQSQEDERKRISRELHDNTAQSLTHLVIRMQKLDTLIPPEETKLKTTMSKLIEIASRTLEEVHEMAFQMRPAILENLGLEDTVRWYISHYLGTATLAVNFEGAEKKVKLPPHVEIAALRIIQEALTNIRKYARASSADANLDLVDEELVITIRDNGEGFDVEKVLAKSAEKKSLGLKGMKERAELLGGSLEIISQPGEGTTITATIPLRFRT